MTRTYVRLEITPPAFNEIAQKLKAAGYAHAFVGGQGGDPVIDMHGIGLAPDMSVKATDTPVNVAAMFGHRSQQGFVQMRLGETVVQLTLDKAREIVGMLQQSIEAAISDQLLVTFLRDKIGMTLEQAGRALLDFRELRQGSRETVIPQ